MALVIADLVQETTSTTGTGTLTLSGAVSGFQSFAAIGDANTTYYRIKSGTDSEVGIGTYTASGTTLSRDTVLYSSAGGTTKITVAAGATVICTYPAERAVAFDANGILTIPDASAFKWSSDLTLYRDAANTLSQRNAANSQAQQLYNTYTSVSDYVRASLSFVTYSGALYTKLAAESAGTGAANIGIALSPKGTGGITAQVPDGTAAGGNARGQYSVDLQTYRSAADRVASGYGSFVAGTICQATADYSTCVGGVYNVASSRATLVGGYQNNASNQYSVALGGSNNTASGVWSSCSGGTNNTASAQYSAILGGTYAVANKQGQFAFGAGVFTSSGDMQYSYLGFAGATTTATTTEIFLGNTANARATIPNSTTWAANIDIVARSSDGTENAYFKRRLVIQKGTTAASTALIGTVQTVGTDIGTTNMLLIATPITLTADTTNGAMKLEVTGIAATNIRWVAKVSLVEVGFA